VVYAGGGTALQRALGVEDTVEAMFSFISGAGTRHPPLEKIRLYCEQSSAHFDWLVAQGLLHFYPMCHRPDRTNGPAWVLRKPASVWGDSCEAWSPDTAAGALRAFLGAA
jgi:hypothetical protein